MTRKRFGFLATAGFALTLGFTGIAAAPAQAACPVLPGQHIYCGTPVRPITNGNPYHYAYQRLNALMHDLLATHTHVHTWVQQHSDATAFPTKGLHVTITPGAYRGGVKIEGTPAHFAVVATDSRDGVAYTIKDDNGKLTYLWH